MSCFLQCQFCLSNSCIRTTILPSPKTHISICRHRRTDAHTHTHTYTHTHRVLEQETLLHLLNLSLSPQNLVSIPLGEQKKNLFLCAKFRVWINSPWLLHFSKCFLDGFIEFPVKTNSSESRLLSYPRPEFCDPGVGAEFHIWPKEKQGEGVEGEYQT